MIKQYQRETEGRGRVVQSRIYIPECSIQLLGCCTARHVDGLQGRRRPGHVGCARDLLHLHSCFFRRPGRIITLCLRNFVTRKCHVVHVIFNCVHVLDARTQYFYACAYKCAYVRSACGLYNWKAWLASRGLEMLLSLTLVM